ncbi:hypothetical protein HZH68_012245 [Vespula germanica]|uniref:Uncharacterized protein n=1 Tax=Vespula germanica TaxID=30212 RepID=A0A834JGL7_VESGE|nr:hypothetical protein HZH68_012245 [Vespula germanica]
MKERRKTESSSRGKEEIEEEEEEEVEEGTEEVPHRLSFRRELKLGLQRGPLKGENKSKRVCIINSKSEVERKCLKMTRKRAKLEGEKDSKGMINVRVWKVEPVDAVRDCCALAETALFCFTVITAIFFSFF